MMALIQVCSSPLERFKKMYFEPMAPISIESCRKSDLNPGRIERTAVAQINAAYQHHTC